MKKIVFLLNMTAAFFLYPFFKYRFKGRNIWLTGGSAGELYVDNGKAMFEYLNEKGYGEAAEALKDSPSAFERWCDNRMIETIKPQKYNSFSAGPLIAYVLARENEIKTVRIVLTCKQNGMSDDSIRGRIREMYV